MTHTIIIFKYSDHVTHFEGIFVIIKCIVLENPQKTAIKKNLYCLPQRVKINGLKKNRSEEKTLILAFVVIVQPIVYIRSQGRRSSTISGEAAKRNTQIKFFPKKSVKLASDFPSPVPTYTLFIAISINF